MRQILEALRKIIGVSRKDSMFCQEIWRLGNIQDTGNKWCKDISGRPHKENGGRSIGENHTRYMTSRQEGPSKGKKRYIG